MKEKTTENFDAINKNATVGTRGKKYFIISPSVPKRGTSVSIKPNKPKKRGCAGCSRKRTKKSG